MPATPRTLPEMRALKGIDIAFLPMNLPYTMSVEKAAEAIRQFKPKVVYPYHYRSHDGTKADFGQLKKLVGEDSGVEIRVRDWYPRTVGGGAVRRGAERMKIEKQFRDARGDDAAFFPGESRKGRAGVASAGVVPPHRRNAADARVSPCRFSRR